MLVRELTQELDNPTSEKCLNLKFREVCLKRGFHWDGMDIPEDVIFLVEKVLDEAADRCFSDVRRIEG